MIKKVVPINYTSKDFDTIRKDLVSYIKRYYPDTYKDFNQASFGSMMMDLIAMVGDNLSFYLDYNANESFMHTSLEFENVVMHAKQLGYKYDPNRTSVGNVDIYIPVPSKGNEVAPDLRYLPKMLRGTVFTTSTGIPFTLNQNVDFNDPNIEVTAAPSESSDGTSTDYYIAKATAQVVSGQENVAVIEIGEFQRFLKVEIPGNNITEILRVVDDEGNEYSEVNYLSQNTVFKEMTRAGVGDNSQPSIIKSFPVPRRFVVERDGANLFLVFGYGSESEIKNNKISDPSDVALKISGKNYVSDTAFDPSNLVTSDKFGVSPDNTNLTVTYRYNTVDNSNTGAGTITNVSSPIIIFENEQQLSREKLDYITTNLTVYNEEPINGDITTPTTEEIKRRAIAQFATQERAVTLKDYVSATYAMPNKFGSVKRAAAIRDNDDLRRNINLFIISENSNSELEKASSGLKNNLTTWLNSVKMVSDSVDILDANVLNLGISFEVFAQSYANKSNLYGEIREKIYQELKEIPPEIGEYLYLTEIFKILKEIDEVLDVVNINLEVKSGGNYSSYSIGLDSLMSVDGRVLQTPMDTIWEVKYVTDISGIIR